MVESRSSALAFRCSWRVGDASVCKDRIGTISTVALVRVSSRRIDLSDSRIEAVVGERIGRRAWISDSGDAGLVVVG